MGPLKEIHLLVSGAASLLAAAVLKSFLGTVFTEEWKAWAPHFAQKIMLGAVKLLPSAKRGRYLEEWSADLFDTPGLIGKIVFAFGLYKAGYMISRENKAKRPDQAEAGKKVGSLALSDTPSLATLEINGRKDRTRVMVVDDEQVIANMLSLILNQSGFQARAAFTGEEAVAIAKDFMPQILIVDVFIPGLNGVETAKQIRSFLPQCRVWLFAGQTFTRDLVKGAIAEGYNFNLLSKPIHPTELLSKIRLAASAA